MLGDCPGLKSAGVEDDGVTGAVLLAERSRELGGDRRRDDGVDPWFEGPPTDIMMVVIL